MMKRIYLLTALVLALFVGVATASAGPKTTSITLPRAMTVGAVVLPAGDYDLSYTGIAPAVQVTIYKLGKVIATSPATFAAGANRYEGVESSKLEKGETIKAIRLSNATLTF